jgi:hypothetical protein
MTYSDAARSVGVAPRTFWFWVKQSQSQADDALIINFLGEPTPFHKAVNAARRMLFHEMRSRFEKRSLLGHDEPIFFSGMPTWRPDPRCVGWTEDEREAFGFRRDGLLEIDGQVVQNVVHHEPPVAAVLRALEVAFAGEYIPNTKSTVTQTINGMVGVQVAKPMSGPPAIPPAPVPPQLEVLSEPEPEPDDLSDLLGDEPEPEGDEPEPEGDEPEADMPDDEPELRPEAVENIERATATRAIPPGWRVELEKLAARNAPKPETVIRQSSPPEYAPEPSPLIRPTDGGRRPLSADEAALLSRLPGNLNRKV